MTETRQKESLLESVRQYLLSLPSDEEREEFIDAIGESVCLLCGSVYVPCYCAPQYDE